MPWGVVGHQAAIEALGREIKRGAVSHAYLLTGLARIGKSTLALALAQALNCDEPSPPCRQCRSCRLIARGTHPDVRTYELREGKSKISFKEVDDLQREAQLRPFEGRYKVYLILDAELFSATAANQLLKTLEEPPASVVLILTASDAEALLPTIVSRCRHLRLRPVPEAEIRQHLEAERQLEPEQARLIARLAGGRVGWALDAATDPSLLDERAARLADLRQLLDGDRLARLRVSRALAERWSAKSDTVREALRAWISWWHDLSLVQAGLEEQVLNVDERPALHREAGRFDQMAGSRAVRRLEQALDDLDRNVNARLALDVALLGLPAPSARP